MYDKNWQIKVLISNAAKFLDIEIETHMSYFHFTRDFPQLIQDKPKNFQKKFQEKEFQMEISYEIHNIESTKIIFKPIPKNFLTINKDILNLQRKGEKKKKNFLKNKTFSCSKCFKVLSFLIFQKKRKEKEFLYYLAFEPTLVS
ncbi:hypothetical protein RFI_28092 [Reticulomyxa filosa]|uniref:Uncharacterized protein n=1 Tax=Reticulomyxa filosa TaxID=46433 RepID=X6M8E3_RETFI|nr:hypothetical protein RFI_28092 [Reticulomyxa filosa]|eukprot:ETO09295.1 hypothetical protein RFI_28092 [Reticulomyxa filosa]